MASNSDTFDPQNLTISEIFSCDRIYRIPNYQRQYSWIDEHLEELWEDLYNEFYKRSEGNDCYFLGSIVVVNNGEMYHDLIDGQQRITTLMILLNVLSKSFPNINASVELTTEKKIVRKATIESRINNENGFERLQLQSYKNYNTTFKNCIINVDNFNNLEKPTDKELKKDEPEYKYKNTAKFFYDKLLSLSEDERGEFVNYIFYNVNIIKIVCNKESFAIKLFQVMNDRGLNLSPSDIIKAYMLGEYDEKDVDGKEAFESDWMAIENIANEYDFKLDEFMVNYEYYKLKSNPTKQMTDELRAIINKGKVKDIISDMKTFAESMREVLKSENNVIYSLLYLPWRAYITTALTSVYHINYENKEKLFEILRRFFYIAFISGKTLNQIKQMSFNVIADIVNKKDLNDIEQMLERMIQEKRMINAVYEALNGEYVYWEKWLKPLMLSLDYELRENMNTTFINIDNKLHMDHILPKAFKSEKDWDYINEAEGKEVLDTLGNMALLSDVKNKEALNKGFSEKIKTYKGLDKNGEIKSGFTTFETTIKIVSDYSVTGEKWDINKIKERKEFLISQIEKMLDICETDKDDRSYIPILEKEEYTEEYHLNNFGENIRELYLKIKDEVLKLGDIDIDYKKYYIAFKGRTNIIDIELYKKYIVITINMKVGTLNDEQNITKDISKVGHRCNGDYKVFVSKEQDIDEIIPLIEQSIEENGK
ncbi:MAG: DUF262 domain-containing protein [Oscillospiraceae bacterium]|nr:DUF262 domain-containing protein [Oscillospiraceae bacterium]